MYKLAVLSIFVLGLAIGIGILYKIAMVDAESSPASAGARE